MNYPRGIYLSSSYSTQSELWFSKVVEIHVFENGENSKLILFPSRLGSITLKPAAFEDVYLPPVAIKASGGRILNTNQLHNKEQVVNTNQQLFFLNDIAPFKIFRFATEETLNYRLS